MAIKTKMKGPSKGKPIKERMRELVRRRFTPPLCRSLMIPVGVESELRSRVRRDGGRGARRRCDGPGGRRRAVGLDVVGEKAEAQGEEVVMI